MTFELDRFMVVRDGGLSLSPDDEFFVWDIIDTREVFRSRDKAKAKARCDALNTPFEARVRQFRDDNLDGHF